MRLTFPIVLKSLMAVVSTNVPGSPFFAFCTPKYRMLQTSNKMRLNIYSMKWRYLGHLQQLSRAKHSLSTMAQTEVCPRDEMADPPGTAVLPIDRHGFSEGFVSFRTLCGVQSSLVRFAPNRAIAWVRHSGRHR